MHRAAAFGPIALLLFGLMGCEGVPAVAPATLARPSMNYTAYYNCLNRSADDAVKNAPNFRAVELDRIAVQVLAVCVSQSGNGSMAQASDFAYSRTTVLNAQTRQLRAENESHLEAQRKQVEAQRKQAALDAPKLAAEAAAAARQYGTCLFGHARVIALNSSESAEVVTKAAFVSCREERQAVLDVHRRYHDGSFDEDRMERMEQYISGNVMLEIITARVPRSPSPPVQPPAGRDVQI